MIILKIFMTIMLTIGIINLVKETFLEIKNGEFFREKRDQIKIKSLLWGSVFEGQPYNLIDLIFDLCYFIINLRKKKLSFFTYIGLTTILMINLSPIPTIFGILLI